MDRERYDENYERIFGKKEIKTWDPNAPELEGPKTWEENRISEENPEGIVINPDAPEDQQLRFLGFKVVDVKVEKPMEWIRNDRPYGRTEWICEHGVGHGNHIHGCCHEKCCARADYPCRGQPDTGP